MLESVQQQYRDIQQTLFKQAPIEVNTPTVIDTDLLGELVDFQQLFYTATCEIEGTVEPTSIWDYISDQLYQWPLRQPTLDIVQQEKHQRLDQVN